MDNLRMSRVLTIPQAANQALSPAQRKFNQLQTQIEKARTSLLVWDEAVPAFAQSFAKLVAPLRQQAERLHRDTALRLDEWLAEKGWSGDDRLDLESVVSDMARVVLEQHGLDDTERATWKALHDRHADLGFDAENAHGVEILKRMFERQTGLDLGDETFEHEDDLLRHVRQKLMDDRDNAPPPPAAPKKRLSAAQQKRQEEREAVERQAKQSLREVFRKLASSLHPDRATDPEDSAHRTEMMQRVNAAYAKEDLLALLKLQLEIEQIDDAHLRSASDAQIKHFNAVLQEQLDELRTEVNMRERNFCADFSLTPRGALNPSKLGPVLSHAQADSRAVLYETHLDFKAVSTREGTKRWLKKLRAATQAAYF
jgi:hypothetical protein